MATAFPPTYHHRTSRVSLTQAHDLLAAYLSASTSDPSLHPDALLTENGPINPSGSHMGLVMHNLRRVEAGLRGEHLGVDLEPEGTERDTVNVDVGVEVGVDAEVSGGTASERVGAEVDMEWQDRSEFEREQEELQGEIGERETGITIGDGKIVPKVERGDKETRKRAKIERRKKERREREEQRKREKEAENAL